jgi:Pectate lyase superfamily protein
LRARELTDSKDQFGAPRRVLLTGGAAGLAAVAATTLGRAQPASAATEPSITDWLNVVSGYGADPTGKTDSTVAIQDALTAAAPGQVVYLPLGTYLISSPLVIQTNGVTLRGCHGATASGNDASLDVGSVPRFHRSSPTAIPGPTWLPVPLSSSS